MRITQSSTGGVVIEIPGAPTLRLAEFNPRAVADSVQGSTAALDMPWLPEVLEHGLTVILAAAGRYMRQESGYADLVQVRQRQLQGAANARRARSERIEAAIRAEAGMLPATMPLARRVAVVRRGIAARLERHDLARVPSDPVIRRYFRVRDASK